jgi:uncharacterized membrane protein YeaQ/YmgE (transglycosylase-associated protein family)
MGILSWLIVGLAAGYVGSKVVNRTGEGLMRDLLLGSLERLSVARFFTRLVMSALPG